jgi:hypothetical protein
MNIDGFHQLLIAGQWASGCISFSRSFPEIEVTLEENNRQN